MKINWDDLTNKLIELRNGERFLVSHVSQIGDRKCVFVESVCRYYLFNVEGRINFDIPREGDIIKVIEKE